MAQVGETMLFINSFRNPTSTCATENERKHNSGKQPTVDFTLEPIQHSGVKHSVGNIIKHWAGSKDLANFDVLHLDTSNSNGWTATAARVCRTLVEADGSSLNATVVRVWINFVQHTKPSHTTSMTQRQKTLIGTKPGHRIHLVLKKLKVAFSSRPSHQNRFCISTNKCKKRQRSSTEVSTNIRFTNLKMTILREKRETIPPTWSSKVSLLSNFTPRMSMLGLARIQTRDNTMSL